MCDDDRRPSPSKATFRLPISSLTKVYQHSHSHHGGVTDRPKSSLASKRRELNFLQKLMTRETTGAVRNSLNPHGPTVRPFTRLPGRLAFCLKDAIPQSALEAGHIFLGFSKCGQFLLSYTQTASDLELGVDVVQIRYIYRLHWWLFVPYRRAKKVAEVVLFANGGCPGHLRIVCSFWPTDMTKVVVFGHQIIDGSEDDIASSSRCYITVTAVPSLHACRECIKVASGYEEDEFASPWSTCVRLSCLEHGMTVHTSFDLVSPYPKFEPRISLKRDGNLLVNSGNLLYLLNFQLEILKGVEEDNYLREKSRLLLQQVFQVPGGTMTSGSPHETNHAGTCVGLFSPSHHSMSAASDSDCESEVATTSSFSASGSFTAIHRRRHFHQLITNPERLDKVSEFAERLSSPFQQVFAARRMLTRSCRDEEGDDDVTTATGSGESYRRKRMAEKAYELTDDDFNEEGGVREKLSTFRRKRLADKKYEFTDDDTENVAPLRPKLRATASSSEASTSAAVEATTSSGTSGSTAAEDTLYISEVDLSGMMDNMAAVPELLSPGGMVKKDQSLASPRSQSSYEGVPTDRPLQFTSRCTRRYVADDESVSVITDMDDDDFDSGATSGTTCIPLTLEVHGAGYQSMSMISNAKAGRISGRCVKVTQSSFDIELMCHDMAQQLCLAAGKKYWYCNDYDVEIVDLDPNSGDVLCVAVVLVMATVLTKRVSPYQTFSISSLQRHQYQAGFKFCWNIDTGDYEVVDSEPLKEICKDTRSGGVWHPARNISSALQKSAAVLGGPSHVRCFTNDSVIHGTSLKTIVDSDHLVAIILDDLD